MSAYVFAPQAEEDLFGIWSYIAQDSLEAADRMESEVYRTCVFLASTPYAGHSRPDLTKLPVKFWTLPRFSRYIIVYDPSPSRYEYCASPWGEKSGRRAAIDPGLSETAAKRTGFRDSQGEPAASAQQKLLARRASFNMLLTLPVR
jgi:antitoxin ParD1/3/4